jgi:hypothetical protein
MNPRALGYGKWGEPSGCCQSPRPVNGRYPYSHNPTHKGTEHMHKILVAIAVALLGKGVIAAFDDTKDVMVPVHQFVDGFNKGDTKQPTRLAQSRRPSSMNFHSTSDTA